MPVVHARRWHIFARRQIYLPGVYATALSFQAFYFQM
jgi:hypothetical protein